MRRCWSPQLGLTFSHDLGEHGVGSPAASPCSRHELSHGLVPALREWRMFGRLAQHCASRPTAVPLPSFSRPSRAEARRPHVASVRVAPKPGG